MRLLPLLALAACAAPPPPFPPTCPVAEVAAPVVLAPESVLLEREEPGWTCTFLFRPERPAAQVTLAGAFNGWSPTATPMSLRSDGAWAVSVELESGRHLYKFVVDGAWTPDPANPRGADDGHGGTNSELLLGAAAGLDATTARRGDGRIAGAGLAHDPNGIADVARGADGSIRVRCRSLRGDVHGIECRVDGFAAEPMRSLLVGDLYEWWEVELPAEARGRQYTFVVRDGAARVRHPDTFLLEPAPGPPPPPEWARGALWYQVFPDRFRNGDPTNDPRNVRPWRSRWFEPSPWEGADGQTFYEYFVFDRFYGGDLAGVRQRLDHLVELGVDALYLNPVFRAASPHRYDATDYLHVDERLGTFADADTSGEDLLDPSTWRWTGSDRLFLEFLAEAKARGLRVILDGVFNHVGVAHPAHRDVLANGRDSRFADWFAMRSWDPVAVDGWAGFDLMPAFAKDARGLVSPSLVAHVAAVTRRWMDPNGDGDPSDGIDGWRLDVPNEIPRPFWVEWCALVRSINPDAYIVGEIWDDASAWLDGTTFDAVMNYPFARVAVAWAGGEIDAREADRRLAELRLAPTHETALGQQTLLDSHDTDRLVSMLANPGRGYDQENRIQDGAPYDDARPGDEVYARARLAALLQMTYVGAPMIYYGDEVGMWGADDPSNRKPMPWADLAPYDDPQDAIDGLHLAHWSALGALRREHAALRVGAFRTAHAGEDLWAYVRTDGDESVLVVLNATEQRASAELPVLDPRDWRRVFGDGELADNRVEQPGLAGSVWVLSR